jgi:hypothetical protein
MKVDMSPQAVTARLRTLDDLWLLSVKLANSKKIKNADQVKSSVNNNKKTQFVSSEINPDNKYE